MMKISIIGAGNVGINMFEALRKKKEIKMVSLFNRSIEKILSHRKKIFITNISCSKLDPDSCRCIDYSNREKNVKACLKLTKDNLHKNSKFLPSSCSYRLISEGKPLPQWHHLLSKDQESVHRTNQSIQKYCVSETSVDKANYEDHIVAEISGK